MMLERLNLLTPIYSAAANQKHYADVFYQACNNGDFELAASMLRCGVNLSVKFENGESLLHIACAKSFYGLVQLLIKFGCNEFLKDRSGRTALHYAAASSNSAPIVRYLIEKNTFGSGEGGLGISGLNGHYSDDEQLTREFLNARDVYGKTPLHLACENNCKEPVRVLLSSGLAELNACDNDENTPLTIAYFAGHWELFEMLVKSGSLLNSRVLCHICKSSNLAAFNILMRYYDSKTLAHLIDEFADENSCLYLSIRSAGSLDLVSRLFQIGVRLTRKDCVDIHADLKSMLTLKHDSDKFLFYLECFILMAKHYAIERRLQLTYSDLYRMTGNSADLCEILTKVDLDDPESLLNVVFIFYLDVIFDLAMVIHPQLDSNAFCRLLYLSALVIYSGQLDLKRKYVQKWLEKKLSPSTGKLSSLNDFKAKSRNIYKGSLDGPWSLQMLCRVYIKKNLKNVDYVLNDKSLVRSLNVPNICVRFLKFEYI